MLTSTIPDLISLYGYNNELIEITDEETGVTTITESKVPIGVATEERSGTEIMIPLINERDWMSFKTSIEKELCYFDDVYTVNLNVENAYTIYRKDTFLYRNTGRYSNELHIVLGKCCYPIDWKSIDREVVELPFGIIFNIGELQVVPNRESIVYDIGEDDTIKNIINAKIDAVLKEVNELLTKGDSFKETDDLVHYLANRNKKPAIWFEGNPVYIPVKYIKNKGAVLQFTPLKHLPITIPDNPFFYYEIVGEIEGESYTRVDSNYGTYSVNYGNKYISLDTPANMYTNAFISNHRYERKVAKKNNIKLNYSRILTQLSLYKYYSKKQLQYRIENNDPHYDYREIDKKLIRQELVLSKHRIVKEYIEVMDRYFEKYLIKYSDLAPDEEWIQNYKNSKKEANLSYQRKLKGQILVKHHFGYKETVTLLDLSKFANVIYYVFEVGKEAEGQKLVSNHASKLNNIYSIAKNETRPYKTNYGTTTKRYVRYWEKEYKFIGIAKSNVPLLKNLENIIPIEEIEEFDIYKKYDQLHTDLMYLKTLEYKVGKFPWGIRSDKVKTITTQIQDIENKFVSWGNYPSNETLLPSKELKEFGDSVIKELEKIEILKYLSFNMPSKFLIPITSKLKSRYLKPNYLGSNPAKEYKERQFKQNIFLL